MARETLTPDQAAELSIFQLPRADATRATDWLLLLVLTFAAITGAMAFIGEFRSTPISRALDAIVPLRIAYFSAIGLAAFALLTSASLRDRGAAYASAMTLAFLGGFSVYGYLHSMFRPDFDIPFRSMADAEGFALFRLLFGIGLAAPMLFVWLVFSGRVHSWALGIENWGLPSRSFSAKETPSAVWRLLIGGYLIFVLIFGALMQSGASFEPIISGVVFTMIGAILLASIVNATVEEVVFRGLIQPSFVAAGGVAAGLWMTGLLFGLMHWGLTVGVLAALPVSLGLGFGSIVWGKITYETRGLGWAIVAHFMIDVAIMAAFFVPRS
jgi:membrane protease YdiL (CAAX protease family)